MLSFISFEMEIFDLHLLFLFRSTVFAAHIQLVLTKSVQLFALISAGGFLTIKNQIMLMTISGWRIKEAWRLQSWFALKILSVFKGRIYWSSYSSKESVFSP